MKPPTRMSAQVDIKCQMVTYPAGTPCDYQCWVSACHVTPQLPLAILSIYCTSILVDIIHSLRPAWALHGN